jgi:dTDP-4-dehydrorhamnose 3,5-epimerase
MPDIQESTAIQGVQIVTLKPYADERGSLTETFRQEWFPQRRWAAVQLNCTRSNAGVLRGLHYHFEQIDYWYVGAGTIRVGLADLRPNSPTYRASQTLEMGVENPVGLFIPVGVAHGFVALTDAILFYAIDNYYTGRDEYGVAWNDPDLAVAWGVASPQVSTRDTTNPCLKDIPAEKLPRLE